MVLAVIAAVAFVVEFVFSLNNAVPRWIGEGPGQRFSREWARKVYRVWEHKIYHLRETILAWGLLAIFILAIAQIFVTPVRWTSGAAVIFAAMVAGNFLGNRVDSFLENLWRRTL